MNDIVWILGLAAAVVAIVIGVSLYSARMQRLRREAIARFADELGLTFSPEDSEQFRSRLIEFQLFKEGRGQKLFNLLRAEAEGVLLSVFDYQFTTGHGKNQHTHKQTVLTVESQALHLPPMTLRPESLLDAIAGVLGFRDIDFEDNPEFSRRFLLKSPNESLTRKLFDAEVFEFFVARRDIALEAGRNRLVVYRRGKRVKPADLKALLADGLQLNNLFAARMSRLELATEPEPLRARDRDVRSTSS